MTAWQSLDAQVSASALPEPLLGALQLDWARAVGNTAPQRTLNVTLGPCPPVPPGLAPQHLRLMDREVPVWARGDEFWLEGHLYGQVGARGARLHAGPGAARDLWALALTEVHRAGGWLPLHAALVSGPAGAAAVLGVSGAGKSTAALRLRAAGWTILAEDRAWVGPQGEAVGLDRTLRAYRDSVARFAPHLLPEFDAAPRDPRGKALLRLDAAPPAPLRGVLCLGAAGIQAVPGAAERVRHAWEASGVPLTARGRAAATQAVQRLVRGPVWQAITRDEVPAAVAALVGSPDGAAP
ncbi:hypothetical protein [Deinococcus multiflagellatus]|uniref:Hpr(Ser) kinase/phosphatase n=1 Tax=Deinococcus multiflagellatus TaxID=1656887 RepID=A0ABW1ZJH4_9DEIO|nr:hypothetical protein [Deinococcus multiflagellatus]MBZ9713241.1 hypothetical protein [Deinococcus multiflagellatus]